MGRLTSAAKRATLPPVLLGKIPLPVCDPIHVAVMPKRGAVCGPAVAQASGLRKENKKSRLARAGPQSGAEKGANPVGFLDKLFGKKSGPPSSFRDRYPERSIVGEPDLKTLADLERHYPLPEGYAYRQKGQTVRDIAVVRQDDGTEFVFLVEEGILAFDVPRRREDGSWGKRTVEVLRR